MRTWKVLHQIAIFFACIPLTAMAKQLETEAFVRVTSASESTFRVAYDFPKKIKGFHFEAAAAGLRSQSWKLLSSDLLLTDTGVVGLDGREFSSAIFEVSMPSRSVLRQYDPILKLSDGSLAIFSEYLLPKTAEWVTVFVLEPRIGHGTVVNGAMRYQHSEWRNRNRSGYTNGAYFYFGQVKPEIRGASSFLFDPATPAWIKEELIMTTDALMRFYKRRLRTAQAVRPSLLVSMAGLDDSGYGHRGDTLSGQFVRVNLFGGGWAIKTEVKLNLLRKLIAHELFHIWNAEFSQPGSTETLPWIHEGSADYAALQSLVSLKLITVQYALDAINNAANSCTLGVVSKPLRNISPASNEQQLYYDCGLLSFYLLDGIMERAAPKRDIFDFFAALFGSKSYTYDTLRMHLSAANQSTRLFDFVDKITITGAPNILHDLTGLLSLTDQSFVISKFDRNRDVYTRMLMETVLKEDCKGDIGYWQLKEGIKVDSNMRCTNFVNFPVLKSAMNIDLIANSKAAYESARLACNGSNHAVVFRTVDNLDILSSCKAALPKVPAEIYFERLMSTKSH